MTPDTDTERDAYELGYRDGESSGYADWENALNEVLGADFEFYPRPVAAEIERLQDELAAVRAIVDGAVTSCELGEAIAAHFGRPLPDWNTD